MIPEITRRALLVGSVAALATACTPSIIFQRDQAKRVEDVNPVPQMGDIVFYKGNPYLLRFNIAMIIRDLGKYLKYSKFERYGGRKLSPAGFVLGDTIDRFPLHEPLDSPNFLDDFSGQWRVGKPFGGEVMVYFPGMMTNRGFPLGNRVLDNDPFDKIRESLTSLKWKLQDSSFFTYGSRLFREYKAEDTFKPVDENIQNALMFLAVLARQHPFVQFNIIVHSLGGIFALEAVMRNMDIVNNLILIDVPFGGFNIESKTVREALDKNPFGENPVEYLSDIYQDGERPKEIQKFGEYFTGKGKGLVVISSQDDPITEESRDIKGAKCVIVKGGHGSALSNEEVHNIVKETIGDNLAMAA